MSNLMQRCVNCKPDRYGYLLRISLIISMLFMIRAGHLPGFIIAEDTALSAVEAILQRANEAASHQSWRDAENYYKQALAQTNEASDRYIRERLQWCYANNSLEKRYSDKSVAGHIRSVEPGRAEAMLEKVSRLIYQNYYQKLNTGDLRDKALLQLQAATENPVVYSCFSVDRRLLTVLRERIKALRSDVRELTSDGPQEWQNLARSLCSLSEKAGLGASWPAIELSYALTDSLDKYSYMLSPYRYSAFRDQLDGYYVGVGIDLIITEATTESPKNDVKTASALQNQGGERVFDAGVIADGCPVVFDVVADGPAQKQGIIPGDILVKVNNVCCRGKNSQQLSGMLVGRAETRVNVVIRRGEKELVLDITRELLAAPSVRYVRMVDNRIGFLRIASFDHDTAFEIRRAVDKLRLAGAESLLIDLRGNGGGVMTSAIEAVRLFIDRGTIVTVWQGEERTKYTAGGDYFSCYSMPLAILVDENTASAAEIFTAAVRDHHRGLIVGQKTFGKALVQTIYNLKPDLTAICITTARYLPPGNKDFHQKGIQPDIPVEVDVFETEKSRHPKTIRYYLSPDNPVLKEAVQQLYRS